MTLAQTASTPASAASTKTYSIKGAGGTFPEVLYQDAMFSYKYVTTNVDVSYLPTGEPAVPRRQHGMARHGTARYDMT